MTTAIIKELENRGCKAQEHKTVKNGVEFQGISIRESDSNISPIVYIDQLEGTVEEIADKVIEIHEKNKKPNIEVDSFMNADFFRTHLLVALQRISHEDIVKKPYLEDMEQYLILVWEDKSIRIKAEHLDYVKLSESEAWDIAIKNTADNSVIRPMNEFMAQMSGMSIEEVNMLMGESPMWVISNKAQVKGASAILCTDLIKQFAKEQGVSRIAFIPSSIHEGIIVPIDRFHMTIEDLNHMVNEVNSNEVAPQDQLSDRAYIIEL